MSHLLGYNGCFNAPKAICYYLRFDLCRVSPMVEKQNGRQALSPFQYLWMDIPHKSIVLTQILHIHLSADLLMHTQPPQRNRRFPWKQKTVIELNKYFTNGQCTSKSIYYI